MAIDSLTFSPGDTDNALLRKILGTLANAGGGTGPATNVAIANGADVALGSKSDLQVAVPLSDPASVISLLRNQIVFLSSIAVQLSVKANESTVGNIETGIGAVNNAAVTNPASNASVIAALKGILTADNLTNTNVGALADAAVTNPASNASVIAALKGLLTLTTTNNNVGGYSVALKDTTAVSASSAYTAGDAVGGKRTITGALRTSNGSGILESITILDRANQKAAMELFIFDSDPSAATITDNSAFVFSTDDLKVLAHVTIATTDYITINSKAVATIKGLGTVLKGANSNTSLYAALVTTGTPTYAATTDVQVIYGILQD